MTFQGCLWSTSLVPIESVWYNNDFDHILHRFRHNYIAMSNKILSYRLQVALSIIKLSFWSNIKYGRNNCPHRPMTSDRCNVHYACCIFEIHTTKPFIVPEMTFKDHQMGRFTFCISLSLRPNGSALVSVRRWVWPITATPSSIHRWFRCISLFIFELVIKLSDFRASKLNL